MDRREFLKQAVMAGIGTAIGLTSISEKIKNAVIYSANDLEMSELFSLSISRLERIIAAKTLFESTNQQSLKMLHNWASKYLEASNQVKYIEEMLAEKIINDSKKFSKKKPSEEEFRKTTEAIDEMLSELHRIKEGIEVSFVKYKKDFFTISNGEAVKFGSDNLKTLYSADNLYNLEISHAEQAGYNSSLHRLSKTIERISQDSEIIFDAYHLSGVSLAKIVAFADIESKGRKFSVGRGGEINRFQLHPKYLKDIYKHALSVKNELSDYINEKTSEKNLIEDVVRDSKLNAFLAVNFMKYLEQRTNEYFQGVIAYNIGLKKTFSLDHRIVKKLKNPKSITEKDLKKYHVYRYYSNFLNAEKSFEEMRGYITSSLQA